MGKFSRNWIGKTHSNSDILDWVTNIDFELLYSVVIMMMFLLTLYIQSFARKTTRKKRLVVSG